MLMMQFSQVSVDFPEIHTWKPEEIEKHIAFMGEVNEALTKSGEWVAAEGLGAPNELKIVRADADGAPVVTEGPFPETKEFLAGYWIVDVESPSRVLEVAAYISSAPGPEGKPLNMPIEVRQIMEAPAPDSW
ncbi:YciI family protein [Catenuloplanes sp. NPDC051500]|uniref:YciI family protein n=1 Tax=Catenuloplanes sp. NPDC051500 TaxID=3363959 RepID=UPI0037B5CA14